MNKKQKAFTLIELLTVIGILGVLISGTAFSYQIYREKSRDSIRLLDMKQLVIALEAYYDDHNFQYPDCDTCDNETNWDTCLKTKLSPYLANIPKDPKGVTPYCYKRLTSPKPDGIYPAIISFALERENSDSDDAVPILPTIPDNYYHYQIEVY
ncbi:type II secretion system protein [Candidatus Falkowbacteria bacterium]|jgi:prepilin-type N-terminal cleavage/methylation domain-containing protein|nr:type II secretion system protein [Patescibacteria group bacterium]MDD3435232.1 type II secretion system protein [Patescibacteria group bacterium]MDD4466596.1 type II secretion system protein [Patescibacteria group bacterium]NCU42851.1 type II secretion system protein [Candidatus Falkowbacteria bacterium]